MLIVAAHAQSSMHNAGKLNCLKLNSFHDQTAQISGCLLGYQLYLISCFITQNNRTTVFATSATTEVFYCLSQCNCYNWRGHCNNLITRVIWVLLEACSLQSAYWYVSSVRSWEMLYKTKGYLFLGKHDNSEPCLWNKMANRIIVFCRLLYLYMFGPQCGK